jgi:response regulator of citrate/malate metabolism
VPKSQSQPWKLLIVEDDPVVASVYRKAMDRQPDFDVKGVVRNGEDALAFLGRWPCDLMLLDLQLAGMNGLTLLHRLRVANNPIEVIALTATRNAETVRAVVQRGAIDYLVKPFTMERMQQALALFTKRAEALDSRELDQGAVDRVCASGEEAKRWLPNGLTRERIDTVRRVLSEQGGPISSSELAGIAGLARVTARRYLEYLVDSGQATVDVGACGQPGRPRKLYAAQAQ